VVERKSSLFFETKILCREGGRMNRIWVKKGDEERPRGRIFKKKAFLRTSCLGKGGRKENQRGVRKPISLNN